MTSTPSGPPNVVAVELDPQALAARGLDPRDLRNTLQAANVTRDNIRVLASDREVLVQAGVFLSQADRSATWWSASEASRFFCVMWRA